MNAEQVLERLNAEGITSSIQMVRRWIREGKIKGERTANRKAGFTVDSEELERFIHSQKHGSSTDLLNELERLREENRRLQEELEIERGVNRTLNQDVHVLSKKLESLEKDQKVNWKRKYDSAIKRGQDKVNELIQAKQDIEILRFKLNALTDNVPGVKDFDFKPFVSMKS